MKRLLLCFALASSPAFASNTGAENLKNIDMCFNAASIHIDSIFKEVATDLNKAIYEKMSEKLRAYRIPVLSCDVTSTELYANVDGFKTSSGTYIYLMSLELTTYDFLPNLVETWSSDYIGTTGQTGSKMTADFVGIVSDLLDSFAADYATANP